MTGVEIVLALIKIIVMIAFLLGLAPIAIWADRRQSAMVQGRPGPNRAVFFIPSMAARGIVVGPPLLFAAIAGFTATMTLTPRAAYEGTIIAIQLAVLAGWFSLLILWKTVHGSGAINRFEELVASAEPRNIFYGGVAAHLAGLFLARLIPRESAPLSARVTLGVLAALLLVIGFYGASRVPDGKVGVRLAGTLHPAADALKLIFKEDFVPTNADKLLHALAPILAIFPAFITFAIIPFGDKLCFGDNGDGEFGFADLGLLQRSVDQGFQCAGHVVNLQVADLNVGILYLFAMAGTSVVGAAIAGWASDNKFSLLGGLRASSQMVSYEVAMGLSLVGLFMIYGSLQLGPMVEWQRENAWGIFIQPLAFFLFLAALNAELKRVPFDAPEGESEIVAGYFLEYSGMKWGMFMAGEYVELLVSSALLTTLFLGGYSLPFLYRDGITVAFGDTTLFQYKMTHLSVTIIQVLTFFGKTIVVSWVQIFFRWTLPRFRYDQIMRLGWTKLLPLAIANMMVTGIVVIAIDSAPVGFQGGLKVVGQVTQALLAVGGLAAVVALVAGLLEPVKREQFLASSAARFAAAAGGSKPSPQQT
ncbi:complex I subunit 1/NuoH family protein [Chondromyces crocatus]|uniref:NADH-quinone oxidoreductase subunit H n=1 Tax=Chondromyces crocatus TaxID=52 RepID=A0A0K1EST7_CHOCO|nr:complex I subunit 1 family protein [Chondromyces crocatus]AKT43864.1 NADH dehydrogenase (ubiquinone) [Chondromyces crocatus]